MERLYKIQDALLDAMCEEISKGTDCIDTDEMYKVMDIFKDSCEAAYYHSVVKAMEDSREYRSMMYDPVKMPEMYTKDMYTRKYSEPEHPMIKAIKMYENTDHAHMTPQERANAMDKMLSDWDRFIDSHKDTMTPEERSVFKSRTIALANKVIG